MKGNLSIICLVGLSICFAFKVPAATYEEACLLYENGHYQQAAEAFSGFLAEPQSLNVVAGDRQRAAGVRRAGAGVSRPLPRSGTGTGGADTRDSE